MLTDKEVINLHDEIMNLFLPKWKIAELYKNTDTYSEIAKDNAKFGLQLLEIIEKYSVKQSNEDDEWDDINPIIPDIER